MKSFVVRVIIITKKLAHPSLEFNCLSWRNYLQEKNISQPMSESRWPNR